MPWVGPIATARIIASARRVDCGRASHSVPKGEVTRIEEMDRRSRNIASECLGTLRQEEGIVLSKYGQEMWFACPEVIFEGW